MRKNKGKVHTLIALLAVMLCMTAFSTVAYAGGGDESYHTEPTETATRPAEPEEAPEYKPGTPFIEDGNLVTRDLLFDEQTNKQYITVETRNGNTFYIVIDYDKPIDEDGEQFYTYFLNMVDEEDLLAIIDDGKKDTPAACNCTEKCTAGKVNTSCPVCSANMSECAGKDATPAEPEETGQPQEESKGSAGGMAVFALLAVVAGGGAFWYFKLRKPKSSVTGSDDLDDFDFDEDDDGEAESDPALETAEPEEPAEQEDDE